MIRIVCSETEFSAAANVGGPPNVTYRTFDLDLTELEAWLAAPKVSGWCNCERRVHGVEVVPGGVAPKAVAEPISMEALHPPRDLMFIAWSGGVATVAFWDELWYVYRNVSGDAISFEKWEHLPAPMKTADQHKFPGAKKEVGRG